MLRRGRDEAERGLEGAGVSVCVSMLDGRGNRVVVGGDRRPSRPERFRRASSPTGPSFLRPTTSTSQNTTTPPTTHHLVKRTRSGVIVHRPAGG